MSEVKIYLMRELTSCLCLAFLHHMEHVSFCHCKERFYSILVLLFSKPAAEHFASSLPPQTFRTDIMYLSKRFSEASEKSLVPLAGTFLGTDHLAVLHSSLSPNRDSLNIFA